MGHSPFWRYVPAQDFIPPGEPYNFSNYNTMHKNFSDRSDGTVIQAEDYYYCSPAGCSQTFDLTPENQGNVYRNDGGVDIYPCPALACANPLDPNCCTNPYKVGYTDG